ncbi:MAG: 50S ribosomal protein L4 [Thermodesulfobacteriota bacterium]
MAVIDVYNVKREKTSQVELREDIFGVPVNRHVLHQVVVSQLANRRAGTASTKTRSEVSRSGKKLYRQKGTGRARSGPASSPTRRGGGVIFGPSPRLYVKKIPKKLKKMALKMALTDKFRAERLVVLSDFSLPDWKTKEFVRVMDGFEVRKALIVTEGKNTNLEVSSRNVPWVKVMRYEGINVYDILNHEHLFLVQSAIPKIEEALVS